LSVTWTVALGGLDVEHDDHDAVDAAERNATPTSPSAVTPL
jgi:hypothetical protein